MRIRITLTPPQYPASFPVNQHSVAAWIYQTVALVAPDFAGFLHNEGFHAEASTKNFKFFVFSLPKLPRYTFVQEAYCFAEGFLQLQIASPLPHFLEAFIAGLTMREQFRVGGQAFAISEIEILAPRSTNRCALLRCRRLPSACNPKAVRPNIMCVRTRKSLGPWSSPIYARNIASCLGLTLTKTN